MSARILRRSALSKLTRPLAASTTSPTFAIRAASSLSQRPDSDYVSFPGAVKSAFTTTLKYDTPADHSPMPTYRVVDQHGVVVDESFKPDLSEAEIVKMYEDMMFVSIMDLIMFDAQRQGRISFYMVSAGEEAVAVGSASALTMEDVIYCQYREQAVFKYRGFEPKDFMDQLFANANDLGKGRNMPVHYGSKKLNIVSRENVIKRSAYPDKVLILPALHFIPSRHATAAGFWGSIRSEDTEAK